MRWGKQDFDRDFDEVYVGSNRARLDLFCTSMGGETFGESSEQCQTTNCYPARTWTGRSTHIRSYPANMAMLQCLFERHTSAMGSLLKLTHATTIMAALALRSCAVLQRKDAGCLCMVKLKGSVEDRRGAFDVDHFEFPDVLRTTPLGLETWCNNNTPCFPPTTVGRPIERPTSSHEGIKMS